jgi:fluoroacetyl-CoA thioesterase
MAENLAVGLTMSRTVAVDRERTISFMGEDNRVYSTPHFVMDMEYVCRDLIFEHLHAGYDSVGTYVEVKHIAATLLGMNVTLTTTITEVEGRRVRLETSARDDLEPIGVCVHERFVVGLEKTAARLQVKRAKLEQ